MAKVRKIILPVVQFDEATLAEALEFLRQKSMERDVDEPVVAQKGVNIVLRGKDLGARRIKALKLMDVPLATVLKYVCELTNTEYKVDDFAVTIVDAKAADEGARQLITRTFKVPPTFLSDLAQQAAGGADDPFGGDAASKPRSLVDLLGDLGIKFQPGESASYLPAQSELIVRTSPANLDLIEQLVEDAYHALPSMIKIRLELYEVPKAEALKILKHDAGKTDGSGAYQMVEALVAANKATLLMSPGTVARPGQLAKMQTGSELSCIESYQEKDGVDAAVVRKVLIGSSFEFEPNLGADGVVVDIRYGLYMTRGEPKTVARMVKAPVSGREVEVETVVVDTLTLSQGITTLTGQTQLLGTMRTSAKVDEPNEIMAFLTATVTKVMR